MKCASAATCSIYLPGLADGAAAAAGGGADSRAAVPGGRRWAAVLPGRQRHAISRAHLSGDDPMSLSRPCCVATVARTSHLLIPRKEAQRHSSAPAVHQVRGSAARQVHAPVPRKWRRTSPSLPRESNLKACVFDFAMQAVTEFHVLVLFPHKLVALNAVSRQPVQTLALTRRSAIGNPLGLAADASTGAMYVFTGRIQNL